MKNQKMTMTHDNEANASYIYFTSIGPGGVDETITYQRMAVGFDNNDKIIALKLFESEEYQFHNRLKYALQYPEVKYDETTNQLIIAFAESDQEKRSITWDANIDLDKSGQILGIEILYADNGYDPNDGRERLHAEGKLDHMAKYIVPFDEIY
jgi:uncharacterized protein YuzE